MLYKNSNLTKIHQNFIEILIKSMKFFKKSLLNIPYDPKNQSLNTLSYRTYNRVVRVFTNERALHHPAETYCSVRLNQSVMSFLSSIESPPECQQKIEKIRKVRRFISEFSPFIVTEFEM